MISPGFLVEGDLEQKFIQNICPSSPVRKINCNGEEVSLDAIAKRVGTLGRLLQKRIHILVVIFDREKRSETSEELEKEFIKLLDSEQLQVPIVVGIPDRDTENWILADPQVFADCTGVVVAQIPLPAEGLKGKTEIKKLLPKTRRYIETIDGVSWLKSCRPDVIKINSPSFARLTLGLNSLSCWWLQQKHLAI